MLAVGRIVLGAALAVFLSISAVDAASPAAKCQAAKLKIAGKYNLCRLTAQSTAVKSGDSGKLGAHLEKCTATFDKLWAQAELKGSTDCPTAGDASVVDTAIAHFATTFAQGISPSRFIDNGDGTITDTRTSLMWEKKDGGNDDGAPNYADPHDVNNTYQWSSSGTIPDGSAFTQFLGQLNNCVAADGGLSSGGFAGHCDWRLPTFQELYALHIQPPVTCSAFPCIEPIFLPTSYSSDLFNGPRYWTVLSYGLGGESCGFDYTSSSDLKTQANWVRAVRNTGGPFIAQ